MNRNNSSILFAIAILFTLSSCAPTLKGTWKVDRYETTNLNQQKTILTNIGTMEFKKNGNGEKNIQYTVFGKTKTDQSAFGWHKAGFYVTIESRGSDFSKTWIVVDNKKKYQKWKSTDGGSGVQILEMSK